MKKIFVFLLLMTLVMPIVVKADMEHIYTYYNKELLVGGQLEVHIPLLYDKEYNFTVNYDSSMLKTDNSMITINEETYLANENGNDNPVEKSNLIQANVENGKATIKVKMTDSCCTVGDKGTPILTMKFTALKEGETEVEIYNGPDVISWPKVTITSNSSKDNGDTKEPVTTTGDSNENNNKKEENNNILLYSSLGANVALLGALIVVILKNKSSKPKVTE